jgi:predicted ATP-binding protein involved in virulence
MKILSFEVIGLLGNEEPVLLRFNSDLNIITGRNGSGKTSALKLIWYIISGNILLALQEVSFKKATLITDEYECIIVRNGWNSCRVKLTIDGVENIFLDEEDSEYDFTNYAEDKANDKLKKKGSSVFLPTFRRIEGGFTLGSSRGSLLSKDKDSIEESLIALSKRLSNERHVFVASLSTVDIVSLLVRKYTDLSEQYTQFQQDTSQAIIQEIKESGDALHDSNDSARLYATTQKLEEIRKKVESMECMRETIMTPIEAVKSLTMKFFKHTGIKLSKTLSFGDAANAVNSDVLSAGEKQMLSFIAYNAFYQNSIIFIDEPELSLHVDWQRQLLPTLLAQQGSNQFVIATHSPFIYSKYPEKEIQIVLDRGDEEV